MPSDPRPTLFLSSTARDLEPFREVVIHVCQRLGIDVIAMEDFGPDPRQAAELCRSKIAEADLFLGLYAHRYGFQPEGFDGKSITHLEYEWARERHPAPPVLAFIVDDELPWAPKWIDRGNSSERLENFKSRLRGAHVVSPLTMPEKLRDELFVHLPKFRAQLDQRRVQSPAPPVALPQPPETYVAHEYTLLQTAQVVGRREELSQLDAWMADLAGPRMLSVVAIGGVGKSALTWKWFHDRAPESLAGKLWWSFYESDAGFDRFIAAALAYCSRQTLESVLALSPVDRESQLLSVLDREPFLLALDGLERILLAYARLDFAHLSDEDLDQHTANAVAGALGLPPGAGETFVAKHRLRQAVDPRAGEFLRKLARVRSSRVLITTRLYPAALQTDFGQEMPGCRAWFLRGLTPDDALALWRAMGVSGDDNELLRIFRTVEYHPLLIRALAGEVSDYRRAPGDFNRWRRDHPTFEPFSLPLIQAKSHVLAHALGHISEAAREVLHTTAAFRSPVDYGTLSALFVEKRTWAPKSLDAVLSELEDRGLLGWDRTENRYDLHPVVRGVVWGGLNSGLRQAVYGELEQHFSALTAGERGITNMAEAIPVIELFNALVALDRRGDASRIYMDRLMDFGWDDDAMGAVRIPLIESLFPHGLDQDPDVAEGKKPLFLFHVSLVYELAGQLRVSLGLAERSFAVAEVSPQFELALMSRLQKEMGNLHEATNKGAEALAVGALDAHRKIEIVMCRALVGDTKGAVNQIAALIQDHDRYERQVGMAEVYALNEDHERAERLISEIPDVNESSAAKERVLAQLYTARGDFVKAIELLSATVRMSRAGGLVARELRGLCGLARVHALRGERLRARSYLDEVHDLASRGPYRLIQADAVNILSEIERDAGNVAAAIAAARDAYALAWCDGPPFAYHWGLLRAERLLKELGAEPPEVQRSREARDSR